MSKRTDIRNAIAAALKAGNTDAGQNVLTSRYTAMFSETFPLILVYTPDEDVELLIPSPAQYDRKLTVNVTGIIQADASIDDSLDTIADQIETVMKKDAIFGGLAMGLVLHKTSSEVETIGETQMGAIHLAYELSYFA